MSTNSLHHYTVKFEPDPEGGYIVTVPAIPAIITSGATLSEAEANAQEAITLYLEVLKSEGRPLPIDDGQAISAQPTFATLNVLMRWSYDWSLGFVIIRTRGSHVFLRRGDREVLIAYHNREFTRALLFSILKQAGLTIEDVRLYL